MCSLRCSTKCQPSSCSESPEDRDDPTSAARAVQCQRSWISLCHRLRKSRLLTWQRILPSLKQMSIEVAELNTDLGAQSAQQQKLDAIRCDEQKIFATTKEDPRQVTADVPARKSSTISRVWEGVFSPKKTNNPFWGLTVFQRKRCKFDWT